MYPYICKYFKFPIGHHVAHAGDTCIDIRACLQTEGLIKCTILPATDLCHPVLPFRCNKKLLLCLCRTCASAQNVRNRVGIHGELQVPDTQLYSGQTHTQIRDPPVPRPPGTEVRSPLLLDLSFIPAYPLCHPKRLGPPLLAKVSLKNQIVRQMPT